MIYESESVNMKKKNGFFIISIISFVCFICVAGILVALLIKDRKDIIQEENLRNDIESIRTVEGHIELEEATETESDTGGYEEIAAEPFEEIVKAQEINEDVIGLLEVGESIVQYVVQGDDNDFYLTHDYTGAYTEIGAAFLDTRNSLVPRDTHWMIHGHTTNNGTMFGTLDDYMDEDYFKQYPFLYLTLMYEKEIYVPYAALEVNVDPNASNYFKITEWNFDTDEAFYDYTGYFKEHSVYDIPIEVTPEDDLLTLSTCTYTYANGRFLLACRKLRADETVESINELIQNQN